MVLNDSQALCQRSVMISIDCGEKQQYQVQQQCAKMIIQIKNYILIGSMFELSAFLDECLPAYFLTSIEPYIRSPDFFNLRSTNNIFSILNSLFRQISKSFTSQALTSLVQKTITAHLAFDTNTYMNNSQQKFHQNKKSLQEVIMNEFGNKQFAFGRIKVLLYQLMVSLLQSRYALNTDRQYPDFSKYLLENIKSFYFEVKLQFSFESMQYSLMQFMSYALHLVLQDIQMTNHYIKFLKKVIKSCELTKPVSLEIQKLLMNSTKTSIPTEQNIHHLEHNHKNHSLEHNQKNYHLDNKPHSVQHNNSKQKSDICQNHKNTKKDFDFKRKLRPHKSSKRSRMMNRGENNIVLTPIKQKKEVKEVDSGSITNKKRININKVNSSVTPQKLKHVGSPMNSQRRSSSRLRKFERFCSPVKIIQEYRKCNIKPFAQRTIHHISNRMFTKKKSQSNNYYEKDRSSIAGTMTQLFESDRKSIKKHKPTPIDLQILVDQTPKPRKKLKENQKFYSHFDNNGSFRVIITR